MNKSKWKLDEPYFFEDKEAEDFNEERYLEQKKQLDERGFSDSETWNLDAVMTEFILPRLKRFIEVRDGSFPSEFIEDDEDELDGDAADASHARSLKKWHEVLDAMVDAFEIHNDDSFGGDTDMGEKMKKMKSGLRLFAKYYCYLWD
jgi:hypothetical protein